jgi:hypothetical protein
LDQLNWRRGKQWIAQYQPRLLLTPAFKT